MIYIINMINTLFVWFHGFISFIFAASPVLELWYVPNLFRSFLRFLYTSNAELMLFMLIPIFFYPSSSQKYWFELSFFFLIFFLSIYLTCTTYTRNEDIVMDVDNLNNLLELTVLYYINTILYFSLLFHFIAPSPLLDVLL